MDQTVSTFYKNAREQVHIILKNYKGRDIIDLRVYWRDDGNNWHPSKKGLAFDVQKLPVLLAALHQAAQLIGEDIPETVSDELLTESEKQTMSRMFNVDGDDIDQIIFE